MPDNPMARPGYIALLSVLIVSTVAAMTVIILFVTSLSTTMNSGDVRKGKIARALADACAESALQTITYGIVDGTTHCDTVAPPAQCNSNWSDLQPWEPNAGEGYCYLIAAYKYEDVDDADTTDDTRWRIRATGLAGDVIKYVEVDAYRSENDDPIDLDSAVAEKWVECVDFPADINTECETN